MLIRTAETQRCVLNSTSALIDGISERSVGTAASIKCDASDLTSTITDMTKQAPCNIMLYSDTAKRSTSWASSSASRCKRKRGAIAFCKICVLKL